MAFIPVKTELRHGQVLRKTPKPPLHRQLLMRSLAPWQGCLPPGLHVPPEQPIFCGDSEPEPNLSVIRGPISDYLGEHPHTAERVNEIRVSSHDYDRSKLRAYAKAGVKECWLLLGPGKQIEVHRQPEGEQFAETAAHGPGGTAKSSFVPGLTAELERLFAA